jgi:hypothetical protein
MCAVPLHCLCSVTCRLDDHKWVTDRKFSLDQEGHQMFWDGPYFTYDDGVPAFSTLFELIDNIKEVRQVTAAGARK